MKSMCVVRLSFCYPVLTYTAILVAVSFPAFPVNLCPCGWQNCSMITDLWIQGKKILMNKKIGYFMITGRGRNEPQFQVGRES